MSNHIVTPKNHLLLSGNGKNKQLKNQTTAVQKMPTNYKVAIIKENKKIETNNTPTNPYQIIVEKMPESVVITSQEGVILYANERLEKLLGIPLKNLMGSNFNRLFKDDEIENFKKIESNFFSKNGVWKTFVRTASNEQNTTGFEVMVNKDQLRKYFEDKKLIKSLNNGF